MNEIKMQLAVKLIEAQHKVAAHDAAEKERVKAQKEVRAALLKPVKELEQMYEAGVLQGDLFTDNEPTD